MSSDSVPPSEPVTPQTPAAGEKPAKKSHIFTILLIGCLLYLMLPMLKAQYYRLSGTPIPEDHIGWRNDFDAALAESRSANKPVLIDFSATWCPPCQVMKREVWPDTGIGQTVKSDYIPLLLDADSPAAQTIYQRYGVQTIPTVLIVDADGKTLRRGEYMSAGQMRLFLKNR